MAWTDTSKDWDYRRPLHRINAGPRLYDTTMKQRPNGRGYPCGCRNPDDCPKPLLTYTDLGRLVFEQLVSALFRAIPGWVPVVSDAYREVEGVLERSFQTWTDFPLAQWHRWYDWNFHVIPTDGYKYLRGDGNDEDVRPGETPLVKGAAMECEWDTGAFGKAPGPMFLKDWRWPMAGDYVWLSGRWIYDCGHDKNGKMRTELHPCKAIAAARWSSEMLMVNTHPVPVLEFMFFISRLGGYHRWRSIKDMDYEFIVDLPPYKETMVASVNSTPNARVNTISLAKKKLYVTAANDPFAGAEGFQEIKTHIVEAIDPPGGGRATQATIKIPLRALDGEPDSAGMVLNLGWYDPDHSQAKRLISCEVRFKHVVVEDAKTGDWSFKFGLNGWWETRSWKNVKKGDRLSIDKTFKLMLTSEDYLRVSAHGAAIDLVGAYFRDTSESDRTIRWPDGRAVDWETEIVGGTKAKARDILDLVLSKLYKTLERGNKALGIIDEVILVGSLRRTAPNAAKDYNTKDFFGYSLKEEGKSAELVLAGGKDYTLSIDIVAEQYVP
jgi:hypothetical protein